MNDHLLAPEDVLDPESLVINSFPGYGTERDTAHPAVEPVTPELHARQYASYIVTFCFCFSLVIELIMRVLNQ